MKIEILIRDKEAKKPFDEIVVPEGIATEVGTYQANDGCTYIVSYSNDGNGLNAAHSLSTFRDTLPLSANARLISDEPSKKYAIALFKPFSTFETKLRQALTLATCAEQGNFDNPDIEHLEERDLGEIYSLFLTDKEYMDEVRRQIGSNGLNKVDLLQYLSSTEESSAWDSLFDRETLPTIRMQFSELRKRRNDIVHFHKITKKRYEETRGLLKQADAELESYIESIKKNVEYPQQKAGRAKNAAGRVRINLANTLDSYSKLVTYENICQSENFQRLAEAATSINAVYGDMKMPDISSIIPDSTRSSLLDAMANNIRTLADSPAYKDSIARIQNVGITGLSNQHLTELAGLASSPDTRRISQDACGEKIKDDSTKDGDGEKNSVEASED